MRDLVRRLMAFLRTTTDVDRREQRTRAALQEADEGLSFGRQALNSLGAWSAGDLERMARLYRERIDDRVGPRFP